MARRKASTKWYSKANIQRELSDERIPKLLGLLSYFFAAYLFVAFLSYCFTWKTDQDKVLQFSWNILFERDLEMANWLGRLGAVVSHQFIYWGFGLASFAMVYFLFQIGRKLFNPFSINLYKLILDTFLMFWVGAPVFHYLLNWTGGFPFGGSIGSNIVEWLHSFAGWAGTLIIFIFTIGALGIWYRNRYINAFNVDGIKSMFSFKRREKQESIEEDDGLEKGPLENEPLLDFDFDLPHDEPNGPLQTKGDKMNGGNSLVLEGQTELELQQPPTPEIKHPADAFEIEIAKPESPVQNYIEDVQMEEDEPLDLEPYDPTKELAKYRYPEVDLLDNYAGQAVEIDRAELEANKNQIISTLSNYKIEIVKIRATIGPTVTLYEIVPAPGVRISKIKNLEDDIALSLAALGIRIIAPIPGKGTIGIEVPNKKKQVVSLREVLLSDKFRHANMELPIALGKTISNEVFVADLSKMPHLLIAGATGQGKSVGINTILMSLLYKKHPSQVKLVLIDPKKVELSIYSKIENHFLAFLPNEEEPIITETKKVINTLNSLCIEMDTRYDLLKKANARNILEYNTKFIARRLNPQKGHKYLPYIILVVDEFADLIMTAGKEVEMPIARLAQLARAIGIHLIIATQRPSVNIITGVIKANFPARIAFKVTSGVDSKTILDRSGADQLIGRGDMLLSIGGDMIRLQCAFVDTPEVERTIDFIGDQASYPTPFFLPEYVGSDEDIDGSGAYSASDLDDYFEDAARLVVQNQQGSTSMIQRRLKLGYNRAGRIMDQLEAFGIVGANEGSKAREVLIHDDFDLSRHLEQIRGAKN